MCATPDACAADRAAAIAAGEVTEAAARPATNRRRISPARVELSACVGTGPRDGVTRATVVGGLAFEQREHAFGAVGRPCGDEAPVGLAQ